MLVLVGTDAGREGSGKMTRAEEIRECLRLAREFGSQAMQNIAYPDARSAANAAYCSARFAAHYARIACEGGEADTLMDCGGDIHGSAEPRGEHFLDGATSPQE